MPLRDWMRRAPEARGCEKILLVSGIAPCTNFTGGIFIKEMLEAIGFAVNDLYVVQNKVLKPDVPPGVASLLNMEVVEKPVEQYYPGRDPRHSEEGIRRRELASLAFLEAQTLPAVREYASRAGCSRIWIILEGQSLIRLADALMRTGDLPLHVQVTDPPASWLSAHRVDRETTEEVLGKFASVMRGARSCAAASWAMAEHYAADYGVKAMPVVPSLPESLSKPAGMLMAGPEPLRIGFAGQLYAKDEWDRLLDALDLMSWQFQGRPIEIHAFAQRVPALEPHHVPHVKFLPWTAVACLIDALAACELNYCPYRFAPDWRQDAELCFPSKVTTYLASGRPVLFHGPDYASPSRFLAKNDAAFICNRPAVEDLAATLHRAFSDPSDYRRIAFNAENAFRCFLTHSTLAKSVSSFLGLGAENAVSARAV